MPSSREPQLFRLLYELRYVQTDMDDVATAIRSYHRVARRVFDVGRSCLVTLGADRRSVVRWLAAPSDSAWDEPMLAAFLRNERTTPPDDTIMAPVHRKGRLWAALALARDDGPFERGDGRALTKLTRALTDVIAKIDDERARSVQERIERKILERLRPQDVFYQILHGIRSLTRYDHSSALLVRTATDDLELVAEQAAWTKTKSRLVGLRVALPGAVRDALDGEAVSGFHFADGRWTPWREGEDPALAEVLAFHRQQAGAVPEHAILCAPLRIRDRLVGVLKVAARTPDCLGEHEAELVRRFQLHAAVALDNLQETATLRQDVLRAERKHAMVNIARGISHDVNNALGSILPIVQQLRAELEDGEFDPERAHADLRHLEQAMQTCRRVFAGLVEFSRDRERPIGRGDLRRAVDNALSILQGSLNRHRIAVETSVPDDLPAVPGLQHELEQLLLNLASNACDAMTGGGTLRIAVAPEDRHVVVRVSDEGEGMSEEQVRRCGEAFYTTKPNGNGLGLSICHSIVQDLRGRIHIDSAPGHGTTVHVALPRSTSAPQPAEEVVS